MSYLRGCASEGSDPLLMYESFMSFDELRGALFHAQLELFSVSFYFLLEPALLVG
jgi:hypothetical protein